MSTTPCDPLDSLPNPNPNPDPNPTVNPVEMSALGLCGRGLSRLAITGLLRELLTGHFQPDQILNSDLAGIIWSDTADTKIPVESIFRLVKKYIGIKPAIAIRPNGMQKEQFAIGGAAGVDRHDARQFSSLWVGSHTVFCLHEKAGAVEILAGEVVGALEKLAPAIRQELRLHKFDVVSVGPPTEVEESAETFGIAVDIGWAYNITWSLKQEEPLLRSILFDTVTG